MLIAVNMPCMIANGVGGQPGTATSTGIYLLSPDTGAQPGMKVK